MAEIILKGLTDEELELELGKIEDKRIEGRTTTSLNINDLYPKFVEVQLGQYDTVVTEDEFQQYTFNDSVYEAVELRYSPENPYLVVEIDGEKKVFFYTKDVLKFIYWNNQALIFRDDNEEYATFGPFLLMNDNNVTFGSTEFDFTD